MKKQTAVEWLVEQVNADCLNSTFINHNLIEKAKAIERAQIIKAHGDKKRVTPTIGNYIETYRGEQYYIDNYGGKDV
jgi:hypothetical protein